MTGPCLCGDPACLACGIGGDDSGDCADCEVRCPSCERRSGLERRIVTTGYPVREGYSGTYSGLRLLKRVPSFYNAGHSGWIDPERYERTDRRQA